jgi:GT2 family glycosyltransferase
VHAEVWVIDNASTDGGFSLVDPIFKNNPLFSFVQNEKNIGLVAFNTIFANTSSKYFLTFDADARLHPKALQSLISFLEENHHAGAVTANLVNADGSLQRYFRRLMTPKLAFYTTVIGRVIDKYFFGLYFYHHYHYQDETLIALTEIEQPSVTCLLLRRGAFGPCVIDPETPFYFTDVGLCKRIYNHGYKIYLLPSAVATHLKSTSFSKMKNVWRTREYYRSLMVYCKKYYPGVAPLLWLILWLDRGLRTVLIHTIGREPIR